MLLLHPTFESPLWAYKCAGCACGFKLSLMQALLTDCTSLDTNSGCATEVVFVVLRFSSLFCRCASWQRGA